VTTIYTTNNRQAQLSSPSGFILLQVAAHIQSHHHEKYTTGKMPCKIHFLLPYQFHNMYVPTETSTYHRKHMMSRNHQNVCLEEMMTVSALVTVNTTPPRPPPLTYIHNSALILMSTFHNFQMNIFKNIFNMLLFYIHIFN
jgi:hypothetical protein